jgi:hypothetical protein
MARVKRGLAANAGPPSVATVFERLQHGDAAGASDAFAADALYAYSDDADNESAPRRVARGRTEIAGALPGPDVAPQLRIGIHDDRDCFVEGDYVDPSGDRVATFCWSAQLDEDGRLARVMCLDCAPVEPSPTWANPVAEPAQDAASVLDRYFRHLGASEFPEAVACFSPDVVYDHPPYRPGTPRAVFHGRAELLDGFVNVRGPTASRQVVVSSLQTGRDCFIEGVVDGIPNGGSFVSSLTLDAEGLIQRYVAFYSPSRAERR